MNAAYSECSPPFHSRIWWCDLPEWCSARKAAGPRREVCPVNEARHVSDCNQNMLFTPQTGGQMALESMKSGNSLLLREAR